MSDPKRPNWTIPLAVLVLGGIAAVIIYFQVKPPTELGPAGIQARSHTVEVQLLKSGTGNLPPEMKSRLTDPKVVPSKVGAWMELKVIGDGKVRPHGEFPAMFVWYKVTDGGKEWPVTYAGTPDSLVAVVPAGYAKAPSTLKLIATAKGKTLGEWAFPALPPAERRLPAKAYPKSVEVLPGIVLTAVRAGDGINLIARSEKAMPQGQVLAVLISGHTYKEAVYPDAKPVPRIILTSDMRGGRRGFMGSANMIIPSAYVKDIDAFDADVFLMSDSELHAEGQIKEASLEVTDTLLITHIAPATITFRPDLKVELAGVTANRVDSTPVLGAKLVSNLVVSEVHVEGSAKVGMDIKSKDGSVSGTVDGNKKALESTSMPAFKVKGTAHVLKALKKQHVVLSVSDVPRRTGAAAG